VKAIAGWTCLVTKVHPLVRGCDTLDQAAHALLGSIHRTKKANFDSPSTIAIALHIFATSIPTKASVD
jgi:hypothetical protein